MCTSIQSLLSHRNELRLSIIFLSFIIQSTFFGCLCVLATSECCKFSRKKRMLSRACNDAAAEVLPMDDFNG